MTDAPDVSRLDEFEGDLPVQRLLETLANPLARRAVYYLVAVERDSLDHLADAVTGWSNVTAGGIATRADRDRVRIRLYHAYLPVLDSLDVVRFDADDRTIDTDETSPTMESFVEWVRERDRLADGDDRR